MDWNENEVPMLQRIRVTLQRRINLIHRLDRISFIAPSSEGTMVQLREMKEFWEWMIEEEKAMILMDGLWRTKKGWHQIRRHLNGLSHPILGNSCNRLNWESFSMLTKQKDWIRIRIIFIYSGYCHQITQQKSHFS